MSSKKMKTLKRRVTVRRLSRRYSDCNASENSSRNKYRGSTLGRNESSSLLTPILDDDKTATNTLAVGAARARKESFHESIKPFIKSYDEKECIAPIRLDEIVFGPWLGSGEYSDVYEIRSFCIKQDVDVTVSGEESDKRELLKKCERYRQTGKARYALKHLKEEYLAKHDPSEYIQAAR